MIRIILQDLSCRNGLENMIETNGFVNHFLLGMEGDPNVLRLGLSTDSL